MAVTVSSATSCLGVQRVVPAVQAAFVGIGHDRAGFLGAREAHCLATLPHDSEFAIGDLVREGAAVLVQIIKDQIGDKGPRLSASVTIPGRLCVLTPYQPIVTVSRRVDDEAERERLLALGNALVAEEDGGLVAGAGYIFRTAAVGASLDDVREDARRLAHEWQAVLAARKGAEENSGHGQTGYAAQSDEKLPPCPCLVRAVVFLH